MIGMTRPRLLTVISIAMLTLQAQPALAQSVFVPGQSITETPQPASGQATRNASSTKCPGEAEDSNCGALNNLQQAHVTLALLYLGIRDRCMERSCRLSVRTIQR